MSNVFSYKMAKGNVFSTDPHDYANPARNPLMIDSINSFKEFG